ncbi:MAG TPA: NAD(P)/FAD-dependent oxidoreductase [Beijerinckiaceae bacterium]|nr:NAD(P)/FAD-dependent oxidoreductase [Beijerinckiaceae bacterium]
MRISRRGFLAGAATFGIAGRAFAVAEVDVAIVGAGAAGLAAAKELRKAGRSFVVLEARARIGGRAYTDDTLGIPFDAGAQYIHWAERNPWKKIADELKVPLEEDASGGIPVVFANGVRMPDDERARRRSAFSRIWQALEAGVSADRSFADAVKGASPEIVGAAGGITQFALGEDPERVSIADYDQLWAGDDYLVPGGYGALVTRWGADVPVRLSTPVSAIRWSGRGVVLETAAGSLVAGAAIVTVPLGVLKAGGIRFAPELPAPLQDALDGLGMGAYTKLALKIDRARVEPLEATDYIELVDGSAVSFEFWPFGRDLCLVMLGGDHARKLCEAGEGAAVDFATARLAGMVGGHIRQAIAGGRLAAWWTDPFARGSYSVARPGRVAARQALRQPVGGKVFLAGEASAGGGAMTVGGATLEGQRVARAVLEAHPWITGSVPRKRHRL